MRAKLIQAAAELLTAGETVSIGAVAKAAGVSKGAVQHHFKTREQLLDAVNEIFLQELDEALGSGDDAMPAALRYARLSVNAPSDEDAERWRGLLVASVRESTIASRWSERAELERQKDQPPNARALLVRLAADGLWLSDLVSIYKISDEERKEVEELMHEILESQSR